MGLHLASCGAGVSLARSVISDRAVVPSHPGRSTDGLMCGEMSREQSFSPSPSSTPPHPVSLFVSVLSVYLFLLSLPSFSCLSLHLLLPLIIFPHLHCSLFVHPPPTHHHNHHHLPLISPSPSPCGGCVLGLRRLVSVQRQ